MAVSFAMVEIEVRGYDVPPGQAIYLDLEAREESLEIPPPDMDQTMHADHPVPSKVESTQVAHGTENVTQTVNKKALFKMNSNGTDEVLDAGNPHASEGVEELSTGNGDGFDTSGNLDVGLSGRGLVGKLPAPVFPSGNRGGKVVVRVSVDRTGRVVSAEYEQRGSTTSDEDLVRAAIAAARMAVFAESEAFVQGGTITYLFTIK